MKSEWEVADPNDEWEAFLCEKFHVSSLLARLLVNRGADTVEKVRQFLEPEFIELGDPYEMKDMDKAVKELVRIRENGEKLVIYGDYDVDGVTGTALYYLVLRKWGWDVAYHIPSRLDDGYGLGKDAIDFLHSKGFNRIMTVDCGITSVEEIDYANSLGFRTIVTDHHETKEEIPRAVAVIDPKRPDDRYPFKDFSGVGVAYKVLQALQAKIGTKDNLEEYLDIVALGTVADIVPLLWENRYFVYKGMKLLEKRKRVGIAKLMELSNVSHFGIKAHDIGFRIAPKINAVGRIDSAYTALRLVLEEDETKAYALAKELIDKNRERQFIENQIYQEALAQLDVMDDLDERRILVLSGKNWHPGVIGIVASRLLSKYHKPTLMISKDGEIARGSARSIDGVDIVKILKGAEDLLEEYGGHKMAAGFSLKTGLIPEFDRRLQELMNDYSSEELVSVIKADAKMSLSDIDESVIADIERLRPYGSGNPEPVFIFEDLDADRIRTVGRMGKNLSVLLREGDKRIEAIGFGFSHVLEDTTHKHVKMSVVANIWDSDWNGKKKLQLNIVDLRVRNAGVSFEDSKRNVMKKRKFANVLSHSGNALVIGDPYIEERMILEASLTLNGRIVILTPSNSIMREFYNSLAPRVKSFDKTVVYVDALNNKLVDADVIFTNVVSFQRVFKDGDQLLICEPQIMYETDTMGEVLETLGSKKVGKLLLFSSFLSKEVEEKIISDFKLNEIFHKFHKKTVGLIDDRNLEEKFQVVSSSIKVGKEKMMLVFSNLKNLREVSKRLCEMYPLMCKSEKIVTCTPNFHPYHHHQIAERVKLGRTRILLTMPSYASTLDDMDKIVYYDFPRNYLSFLKPPMLFENGNHFPIIHLLFGYSDFLENMNDIDSLFPPYEKIVAAAKILSENCDSMPEECLVSRGISESKAIARIYLSILSEANAFDGMKCTRIPTEEEVKHTTREREGEIEKKIESSLKSSLMEGKTRDIAKIFHNPFDGSYAKSVS